MTGQGGWTPVESRAEFLRLVAGRVLEGDDAVFTLHADGTISGWIGEEPLSGTWDWRGRYFYRRTRIGGVDFGACFETIEVRAGEMRYVRDRGHGVAHVVRVRPGVEGGGDAS